MMIGMLKRNLSDKRAYFAGFGAIGGLLSALSYDLIGLDSPFASWVVGTGFDGLFIAALLALAQGRYAGKKFDARSLWRTALIGGVGGCVGGFIALFGGFPIAGLFGGGDDAGRFLGWTLGGLVVGFAVSRVVPNLKPKTASFAGAVGGLLGCMLMYVIASLAFGVATTGAAIGLAIALAETAFRTAWLEVTIRPRGLSLEKERSLTVTLGKQPVLFGCSGDSDVRLSEMPGAKSHFAKVSLSGGRVTLHDLVTERSRPLSINETFQLSNARIVVRAKVG
jgi:hypothetical protein